MTDWNHAFTILENHKSELPESVPDKDTYIKSLKLYAQREKDDHKAATQIAVDAAKTFVQIAIAFIVAIVGFAQFSFRNSPTTLKLSLTVAGALAFISMCSGFLVIGKAYKRGDGREHAEDIPWSTTSIMWPINIQALTGVLSLVFFATALLLFKWGGVPTQMTMTLPDGRTTAVTNVEPLTISGQWSNLAIKQTGFTLNLDSVPQNERREFRLEVK